MAHITRKSLTYPEKIIDTYVELIQDASFRRNAIEKFNTLSQEGYNTQVSAEDYLEYVEKCLSKFDFDSKSHLLVYATVLMSADGRYKKEEIDIIDRIMSIHNF